MAELKGFNNEMLWSSLGLLVTSLMLMMCSLTVPLASGAIGPLYATGAFAGFFYG